MFKFKIGCTSNTYMNWPLEKAMESMARLGCEGVQVMCDRPHLYPEDNNKESLTKFKDFAKKLRLELPSLDSVHVPSLAPLIEQGGQKKSLWNAFDWTGDEPLFTSAPEYLRRARIDYTKQCVDMAYDLGIDKVQIASGRTVSRPDLARTWFLEGLKECVEYSSKKKIYIILELYGDLICANTDEALEVFQELDSPWLGITFDIGHLYVQHIDLVNAIKKMAKYIFNVHIEDMMMHKHFHLALGRGEIDLKSCLRALRDINYQHFVCLELYTYKGDPEPAVQESMSYFAKLAKEVG